MLWKGHGIDSHVNMVKLHLFVSHTLSMSFGNFARECLEMESNLWLVSC